MPQDADGRREEFSSGFTSPIRSSARTQFSFHPPQPIPSPGPHRPLKITSIHRVQWLDGETHPCRPASVTSSWVSRPCFSHLPPPPAPQFPSFRVAPPTDFDVVTRQYHFPGVVGEDLDGWSQRMRRRARCLGHNPFPNLPRLYRPPRPTPALQTPLRRRTERRIAITAATPTPTVTMTPAMSPSSPSPALIRLRKIAPSPA